MKNTLILILILCPLFTYSQRLTFEYSTGYGTYQLKNIRDYQRSRYNVLEVTESFPGYITHTAALGYATGDEQYGANFSYLTTGGRLNVTDYSGSVTIDMIMNGFRLGPYYRMYFKTAYPRIETYVQVGAGVLFSDFIIRNKITVYSETRHLTDKLNGIGMYIEPTLGASYWLTKNSYVSLGAGYELDIPGTLKESGNETNLKANWNGIRLYGGLTYMLPLQKNTHNE